MLGIKNTVDFFIIFTYETAIKANALDIAVYDVTESISFISSLNNGIILILSIFKPKACG